jgi:hypothetical protein
MVETVTPMDIIRIETNIARPTTIQTDATVHTTEMNVATDARTIAMTATIITTAIIHMLL